MIHDRDAMEWDGTPYVTRRWVPHGTVSVGVSTLIVDSIYDSVLRWPVAVPQILRSKECVLLLLNGLLKSINLCSLCV